MTGGCYHGAARNRPADPPQPARLYQGGACNHINRQPWGAWALGIGAMLYLAMR